MSFEEVSGSESLKNKNIRALESLDDNRLSEEAILLKEAFLALGDEKAASVTGEGMAKIDLLFLKAEKYDITPKSILFMREEIDSDAVVLIREKLKDFAQLKGRTEAIMRQESEQATEIADLLAELIEAS